MAMASACKSCRRAALPLVPSPLAGEGTMGAHGCEWVRGLREQPLTHSSVWQQRTALSRKGRGHNNGRIDSISEGSAIMNGDRRDLIPGVAIDETQKR